MGSPRSPSDKLIEVEGLFRRGSKGYQCAIDVIMRNKRLSMNERTLICTKVGCSIKTLEKTLTTLRKAGLYDAVDDELVPEEPPKPLEQEEPPEEDRTIPKAEPEPKVEVEESEEIEEKYVTVEDFNQFVREMKALMGITPIQEPDFEPETYVEEQYEVPVAESVELEDVSLKQMGTWVEHKIMLYFDFAKNGAFGGVLEDFGKDEEGKKIPSSKLWSDFVNVVIDDYFRVVHKVGMGLLSRKFA